MKSLEYDPRKGEIENVIDALEHVAGKMFPGLKRPEPQGSEMRNLFALLQAVDAALPGSGTAKKPAKANAKK